MLVARFGSPGLSGVVAQLVLVLSLLSRPVMAADAAALLRQGVALRRAGHDAEALKLFQQAYQIEPTPRALAQMAAAEQALGKWGAADRHYRRALTDESDPWILKNRAVLTKAL